MEISERINGYHVYIGGTWCEVTKDGEHVFDGNVEEDMKSEEVLRALHLTN